MFQFVMLAVVVCAACIWLSNNDDGPRFGC